MRDGMLSLYLAHRSELLNYASGIVGDRSQAEDVLQEAWLRFGAAADGRALEEPLGYLYRIVRNLALDGRRRAVREGRRNEVAEEEITGEATSPEAEALASRELELLMAAMAELPERTRIALEMRRLGGCKLKDIASHLGVSVTVAHDIVADGIAHCRRRVRPSP
ncbi:sigma-70 family RNA polymerase sigma factor [Pseudomonas sp. Milli4]|uniref:Sigma-70 family RNA polymerase sigma factor n=1 Tax=Pseudomonas schmalbachii TaxID=2816993 RepID=A0ABS3TKW8_9PSED|nr:sigma-70 family RNA polymerase sigma factor [Pseudomonas schmalbachii]